MRRAGGRRAAGRRRGGARNRERDGDEDDGAAHRDHVDLGERLRRWRRATTSHPARGCRRRPRRTRAVIARSGGTDGVMSKPAGRRQGRRARGCAPRAHTDVSRRERRHERRSSSSPPQSRTVEHRGCLARACRPRRVGTLRARAGRARPAGPRRARARCTRRNNNNPGARATARDDGSSSAPRRDRRDGVGR